MEYALYHGRAGQFCAGEFLPAPCRESIRIRLGAEAEALKRRMFECFTTQQTTLAPFSRAVECFRTAPNYDFTEAPHAGKLYYENFDWGATGAEWRELASRAATELETVRT